MAIPSVVQGTVEVEGKVFELDSPKGAAWLETISSFRFEPSGDGKPCTIRREPSGYWYGCRKVAGKVRKKYIGKTSEVSTAKLEEIAAALEVPPVPQVAQVAEVAQGVAEVTQVADKVAQDRLTVLELEVANLRKALEALQEALPGKFEVGDFEELPKVDSKVTEELQNELSNLKAENQKLRADYAALLESSTHITNKLRQELQELRSQLETEKTRGEELWEELTDTEQALAEVRSENSELKKTCAELRSELEEARGPQHKFYTEIENLKERNRLLIIKSREERQKLEEELKILKYRDKSQSRRLAEKQARLDELESGAEQQNSTTASKDLPEAADLLNQLKSKRKKSKADLADLETILEILES